MVKLDERDLFVHPHFKQELQKRLGTEIFTLPQIFIDGKLIGVSDYVMISGNKERVCFC